MRRSDNITRCGFTLVELMIVVSILGILAAIVMPHFQNYQQQAREAAAKDLLRTVRSQIELYKLHHNGQVPGYVLLTGQTTPSLAHQTMVLPYQFIGTTATGGMASTSTTPSASYPHGPYLNRLPKNPFNDRTDIKYVTTTFTADDATGWLYKRDTAEFRLNKTGTDSAGVAYIEY